MSKVNFEYSIINLTVGSVVKLGDMSFYCQISFSYSFTVKFKLSKFYKIGNNPKHLQLTSYSRILDPRKLGFLYKPIKLLKMLTASSVYTQNNTKNLDFYVLLVDLFSNLRNSKS